MRVRARVKATEYLPEWAKCCDYAMQIFAEKAEMVLDTETPFTSDHATCRNCGRRTEPVTFATNILTGKIFPIDLLDLDEGPMEVA